MSGLFPIFLRLEGRKCLVVGAGRIAATKASGLLRAGARVVVVGRRAVGWIRSRAKAGELIWHPRSFARKDLRECFIVVAATDSMLTNHEVFRACRAQQVLCNVVDDPEYCDFFYPAVVRRGSLQIAISTSGQSPALAARIRRELEKQFGKEWADYVEELGERRREILEIALPPKKRRKLLITMAKEQLAKRSAVSVRKKSRAGRT